MIDSGQSDKNMRKKQFALLFFGWGGGAAIDFAHAK